MDESRAEAHDRFHSMTDHDVLDRVSTMAAESLTPDLFASWVVVKHWILVAIDKSAAAMQTSLNLGQEPIQSDRNQYRNGKS